MIDECIVLVSPSKCVDKKWLRVHKYESNVGFSYDFLFQ